MLFGNCCADKTRVHFHSVAFCALAMGILADRFGPEWGLLGGLAGAVNPTDVYYSPNEIDGLPTGAIQANLNWTKSGPCSKLLATRYSYGFC